MNFQVNAQHLRKAAETSEFTDYILVNDSLNIAPAHDILILYNETGEALRVLEQEIVPVRIDDDQKEFLETEAALIIEKNDKPVLEVSFPRMHRKQRVASLIVRSSRQDVDNEMRFHVVKRLKFRVYKHETSPPLQQVTPSPQQAQDSPLANGDWYKIPVTKDGIYRINEAYLNDLGINTSSVNPENIQIWGTNGFELPALNNAARPDFEQIPILVNEESDDTFDSGDYILFYGNSPNQVTYDESENTYNFNVHSFSNENYVFLTVGTEPGLRLEETEYSGGSRNVTQFRDYIWLKEEKYKSESSIKSGTHWLGQLFSSSVASSQTILQDTIPGFIPNSPVDVNIRMAARSESSSRFDLRINGESLNSLNINSIFSTNSSTGQSARFAELNQTLGNIQAPDDILQIDATFAPLASSANGWVDWIQVQLNRNLEAKNGKLIFYAPEDGNSSEGASYTISGFDNQPILMDITDPANPRLLRVNESAGSYTFDYGTTPGTRFIAHDSFHTPGEGQPVAKQNIRGLSGYPDYIIITNELFLDEARELAEYRRDKDGLRPVIVTQDQIFNEFSGGVPDMRAIRDYVKYLYDRADINNLPAYLLFFGDTTFDYKNIIKDNGEKNHIFTYQSDESIDRVSSFGSDDYFGLLGESAGEWRSGDRSQRIDIGIGRLPIQTPEDAQILIDKIKSYEQQGKTGDWRTLFSFSADDDASGSNNDRDLHLLNADYTAELIDREATGIRLNKIYQFSYPVENTSSGRRQPLATKAFIDRINNGTLVMNFSGHGNERFLSDERLFSIDNISSLTNRDKLSIFVTATCSFGRFDDNETQSGAEQILLHSDGGMAAAFTTTRVVYTGRNPNVDNFGLNVELTRQMVQREDNGRPRRLGDIYRLTKNTSVGASFNSRKFILLGDPAMRIGLPDNNINISKINGDPIGENTFKFKALDKVSIEGEVKGSNNTINTAFNGEATLRVFDVERFVDYPNLSWVNNSNCLNTAGCGYNVQNDIIFNGRVSVTNGRFSSEFIVPKDISYSDSKGMVQVYAEQAASDAVGAYSNFTLNGRNPNAEDDSNGPDIDLYLNDETFFNGSLVNDSPRLIARLSDDMGINTGGGIGHEIIAILTTEPHDGKEETIILNEFYQSEIDDYTRGRLEYPLDNLKEGRYKLQLRAFDVFNNLGEEEINFEVADSRKLEIANMYNYPNPMHNFTNFMFEHNQQGNPMDISIRIYTLSGRPVARIERESFISSGNTARIEWNGRDDDNHKLATGSYIYHIKIKTETIDGRQIIDKIERLVVVR
ncbi:MAG: type IX secretion system sortase PorU [Balneolales bacterium]